jgi:hypothetical protein
MRLENLIDAAAERFSPFLNELLALAWRTSSDAHRRRRATGPRLRGCGLRSQAGTLGNVVDTIIPPEAIGSGWAWAKVHNYRERHGGRWLDAVAYPAKAHPVPYDRAGSIIVYERQ